MAVYLQSLEQPDRGRCAVHRELWRIAPTAGFAITIASRASGNPTSRLKVFADTAANVILEVTKIFPALFFEVLAASHSPCLTCLGLFGGNC